MDSNETELQRRSQLSPVKQALLKKRLQNETHSNSQLNQIPRRPQNCAIPLSYAQERLWLAEGLSGAAIYNMFSSILIKGKLDISALERSIQEIVQRHEILRTSFSDVEGKPIQVIGSTSLTLPLVDLRHLAIDKQQQEVQRLTISEQTQAFDLAKDPLLRVQLLHLSEAEYLMLLTIHHIVADAWSRGIFLQELATLYTAFSQGKSSPLLELPIQYADYAIWQRQQLQGELLETQLAYWQEKLQGELPILNLPTDCPRPRSQSYKGASLSFTLPQTLANSLQALSHQESVTLFVTLLAAFKVLLHRYTGQDDILVGSPFANRNRPEIEKLIGFFVNTLVLRSDLSGNVSFRELVSRVREVVLGAIAHQDLPFEKLLESLSQRHPSSNPPFQVMFSLQNLPDVTLELPGVTLRFPEVENQTAFFDLVLSITQTKQGLTGVMEYNTDLFNRDAIARMLGHYQVLLAGIIANPDQAISKLPLLTAKEQATLATWQQIECHYPSDKCLHQLFEAQVEQTPNAVAIVFENEQLTYRELNQKANQLAHHLHSLGIKTQAKVGLCVERSIEMVVGILGILKAGAAYVPIDPNYPQQRLEFILADAQVELLLTQSQFNIEYPTQLALDTFFSNTQSVENLNLEITPDNIAYVIYTSGSTGTPKGVLCTHYNVVRLFQATQAWFNFNSHDVWTLFHSIAFDFSVWELWGALLHGGKLAIVPYWVSRSPEEFYAMLSQQKVTVLNQTPSAFRQLMRVDAERDRHDLNLRFVIFGGEALEIQSLQPWLEKHGRSPQLINMYGITETTVHVTYRPITIADISNHCGNIIGRPIPDLQVYLLDQNQQPVPIGIPGEIYVGGAGVASGYLNRTETNSKFIPHLFNNNSSARLYRTGDLARYLANGEMEYLGRIDNQVKIRGFRIEIGEIEATLATHPEVAEVVVLVRELEDKQIIAYVVPQQKHSELTTNLRQFLQQKLPDYMLPSAFVILDTLPLTSNGKVDRQALPAPDHNRFDIATSLVAPRTPIEKALAEIWSELLHIEFIGIHENFFEIGGHSLLATQLLSRIRQQFQVDLPLKIIFTVGFTIAELAKIIREYQLQQVETDDIVALLQEINALSDQEVLMTLNQLQ
ncbi:non-ribosomal peptide synthetase [Gloeocapsopsis sp. IPPAS B-1203]|uniref:non-ribosomal peptide synthetase n=1 Tax=Gloeocapsopsis sp. IPPAS B-1203 TaxID=2049454 RepID=UPI000C17B1E4|nr:non-ribosomal peptide synthetase [Gloeocapsopsis sp. IPPAS B-1203]PIG93642.1 non-ribosomal peptide synthetase [Gloeocapsopsis sp. IPPAS B-1203]